MNYKLQITNYELRISKGGGDEVDKQGNEVGNEALANDDEGGPMGAKLATDGGNGCYTRCVEQAEDEEGIAAGGVEHSEDGGFVGEQDAEGADNALLGHEARDEGCDPTPIAKAEWREDGCYETCHLCQHAL